MDLSVESHWVKGFCVVIVSLANMILGVDSRTTGTSEDDLHSISAALIPQHSSSLDFEE